MEKQNTEILFGGRTVKLQVVLQFRGDRNLIVDRLRAVAAGPKLRMTIVIGDGYTAKPGLALLFDELLELEVIINTDEEPKTIVERVAAMTGEDVVVEVRGAGLVPTSQAIEAWKEFARMVRAHEEQP